MTSFGKGLVQGTFGLDGGYMIKLTTGKWYTPSGRSIQKERILTDDGQLVETHPDSLETDSARKARPKFKSDGGRVVYGGGAITPDVIVAYDTLTTPEQKLARALAGKNGLETALGLDAYALEMKTKVKPDLRRDGGNARRALPAPREARRGGRPQAVGRRARRTSTADTRQPDLGICLRRLDGQAPAGRRRSTSS